MDTYKILSNKVVSVTGTPETVTYQVPPSAKTQVGGVSGPVPSPLAASVNTQSLVTSLYVCNTSSADNVAVTVDVSNYDAAAPVVTTLHQSFLYPQNTLAFTLNLTLKESDELRVKITQGSGTPDIYVTVFGIEMVTGNGPHG
jgi:hypothetical protein